MNKRAIIGIVITDANVVINVPCAMSFSSPPYSRHSIVPFVATGMAAVITHTPKRSCSFTNIPNTKYVRSGTIISFNNAKI